MVVSNSSILVIVMTFLYGSPGGTFLLITYHLLLTTYYLSLITYYLSLITYYGSHGGAVLLIIYHLFTLLLTTYYLSLITYYLLRTTEAMGGRFYLRNRFALAVICCLIYHWLEVSRLSG